MYDEFRKEERPVEEVKVTEVKVIRENDGSALVEYNEKGLLERVTISSKVLINGNKVKDVQLKKGIPFGIDWSDINMPVITPQMLNQELRSRGIWTADDVRSNPQAVRNAISKVQGELFSNIVKFVTDK